MAKLKWDGELAILDGSVVGTITECREGWSARGCDTDWEDVNLGFHRTVAEAKKRIKSWVDAHFD